MNILITGASRGIGFGLLEKYSKKANKIYALFKDSANLEKLSKFSNVVPIIVDVSDFEELRNSIKKIDDIDLIILNAGISTPHSASFPPFDAFKKVIDVNFLSNHIILEYLLPKMQSVKKGKIVFISSLASIVASPTSLAYSASKRALNSYVDSLRNIVSKDNIDVINILPGFIKTDMTDKNDFYMPFLMDLDEGVERIYNAIEKSKKFYAFPKRFYYLLKIFNLLPINIQDLMLKKFLK